jgi:transcriptional regulator with XRE-family HTH domain
MISPTVKSIRKILDIFNISYADLASLLNVQRLTIYRFLTGEEATEDQQAFLDYVEGAAIYLAHTTRIDTLIKRPIFDNKSLLDLLKTHKADISHLLKIKELAIKEETARNTKKGSGKTLLPLNQLESTPIYNKD